MTKIQFNSTNLKNFRNTMAKYHVARSLKADTINELTDSRNAYQKVLNKDIEQLLKLEKGETEGITRSKSEIEDDAKSAKANVVRLTASIKAATEKCEKSTAEAEKLITEDLYLAYVEYISDKGNNDGKAFAQAVAEWFKAQGASDATPENTIGFVGVIGSKDNGNRQQALTGNFEGAVTLKTFKKRFLGNLADNLQAAGIIAPYKYKFEVKKNRK